MRSIETSFAFPLSAVKPLDRLLAYRQFCIDLVRSAQNLSSLQRTNCPACNAQGSLWGEVDGLEYLRCGACSSVFLKQVPEVTQWVRVLGEVSERRNSSETLDTSIVQSRVENVYAPKLDWIHNTLRLHGVSHPKVAEITTLPSPFTTLLVESPALAEVITVEESQMILDTSAPLTRVFDAAVLLESLDRAHDPGKLLEATRKHLHKGDLIFLTALVCSGFDMVVLGTANRYLYPPDRTNCFSLSGLEKLLVRTGYKVVELSTPGVLDVEIVAAHVKDIPNLKLSAFEKQLVAADQETRTAFQSFLQQNRLSSFARIVARKVL